MQKNILITGGAGYIGSTLVPMLLASGHNVTVLDTFMYGPSLLDAVHYESLTVVRGDARDAKLMTRLMKGMDYIIPLAAIVGATACDRNPDRAASVNVDAVKLVLKLRKSRQRIIFPNTNSGYGIGQKGKCQSGLAHGRTPGENDQIGFLEPGGQGVEVLEAGGHAHDLALGIALDQLEGLTQKRTDRREALFNRGFTDGENLALG